MDPKFELIEKMEAKGVSIPQAAEAMEFDKTILSLYLANDSYPVPPRILKKLEEAISK